MKTIKQAVSGARSFAEVMSTKHSPHGDVARVKVGDEEVKGTRALILLFSGLVGGGD